MEHQKHFFSHYTSRLKPPSANPLSAKEYSVQNLPVQNTCSAQNLPDLMLVWPGGTTSKYDVFSM